VRALTDRIIDCVSVSVFDFKSILDVLNSPDSWPEGALVRRYFKPKHG